MRLSSLITLALLLFGVSLSADHVRWQSDYEAAREEAVRTEKSLIVFLMPKECESCQEILRETFNNQPYIKTINQNYIAVLITKDQKRSYPIELLYTLEYPALFFLSADEVFERDTLSGNIVPAQLVESFK